MSDREEGREVDMVRRAIDELRVLPPVDRAAVSRIVSAAVAARAGVGTATSDETPAYLPAPRPRFFAVVMVASIAAAGIIGFALRGAFSDSSPGAGTAAAPTGALTPVAGANYDLARIPTQFQLARPEAKEVRLVGDFNGWGSDTLRLTRDPNGIWVTTVPMVPGRHTYAFVVDGVVVLDPRQPSVKDPEFGILRSVMIVGKP